MDLSVVLTFWVLFSGSVYNDNNYNSINDNNIDDNDMSNNKSFRKYSLSYPKPP